ncbi:MAG: 2-oxoglutarate dehydrogenase complex dihydrolipoyllysine-residue succinyltransferase, partial [Alphaproteobacteria bacterium]
MATEIVVPTLGESVVEATVAKWLKSVGDRVEVDDPLVELETEKVTVEVNAKAAGVLADIAVPEGEDVAVGATLGSIDEAGKADGKAAKPASKDAKTSAKPADAEAKPAKPADAAKPAKAAEAKKTAKSSGGGSDLDNTIDIIVPTLGESVSEATVAKWFKAVGDTVDADDPIVELETEKVTLEVNAPAAGVIAEIDAAEGADVAVGGLLGRLKAGPGATVTVESAGPDPVVAKQEPAATPAPAPAPMAAPRPAAAPAAAKANLAHPLAPAVRKLVEEHNLDPAKIPASGKDGRLTKADVQAFVAQPKAAPVSASAPAQFPTAAELPPREARSDEQRVRMTRLRQRIAQRLKEAQNTAAMLTTFNEVDMTAVMALRNQYKDVFEKKHGVRLGFMSFFVKAAIEALKEVPAVNAEIYGDELIYKNYYDIGVAVGTAQGLVVPVLRGADSMSFAAIESGITELALRARDGKLSMAELTGGTFTITNGGVYGSLLSTPILNPPQSGILGMHKIQSRPMEVGGEVKLRPMMYLALSYDHRIIDGREAVTFLVRVKEAIEDPTRLLVG